MKRSKLFLGITTGVLAVVAFTAEKSAKFSTRLHGYITSTNAKCTLPAIANQYYTVGAPNSGIAETFNGRTIYEYKKGACVNPLFTIPGND